MPLSMFLQCRYYVPFFKVNRLVSGSKTRVQYVTLVRFCYIDRHVFLSFYYIASGMYCGGL